MPDALEELAEEYASWWIDFLGEHNHIGGEEATRWLLERARLAPGDRMLDAGAFVGASARTAAGTGAVAVATDMNADFLAAGRKMPGGEAVRWVVGTTQKLPFTDGAFTSVWCLDSYIAPRELSRVAAVRSTLCLCCEVPADGRGGVEAFIDEWSEYGWQLSAHRQMNSEATQTWRRAEAELVRKRPHFEERYGTRPYLGQLDMLANMVQGYERGAQGHGLFVFTRGD
ncbi:MAG: methyltransferase domain-containing protein [Tepidiformaceae bacterium]